MNREIKFRAWSKSRNKMLQPGDTTPVFWPSLRLCEYNDYGSQVTLEIMQFTGLQDKNGKDIYEGDIVKTSFNKHWWIFVIKSVGGYFGDNLYAIELYANTSTHEDQYTYEVTTESEGRREPCYGGRSSEIIGNIHENPELLESQS